MICCNVGRTFPSNYVMLTIYTLATSFMMFYFSLSYTAASMYMAWSIACGIAFALMLYATFTKRDFTGCGPYLFVVSMGLFIGSLAYVIFFYAIGMWAPAWWIIALNVVL